MRISLIVMLVLGFVLVIVIFGLVSQRKAVTTCNDANNELEQKLQETTYALRNAETKQTEDNESLEGKLEAQTKEMENLKAQFEDSLSRKNAHITQLTQELQRYAVALEQTKMQFQSMLQQQGPSTKTPPPASQVEGAQCDPVTGTCSVTEPPVVTQPEVKSVQTEPQVESTFPSQVFEGTETTVVTVNP